MRTLPRFAASLLVLVAFSGPARLGAQVTEVARTPIADAAQLTFGYLCDDRFVVRNDGTKAVDVEYSVAKSNQHTKLTLNARESVELDSPSKQAMELWMDGKLIAKADKEKRSCTKVQGNASVSVAPLEVASTERDRRAAYGYPYGFGGYPFFDPWFYGSYYYGGLGYRGYYSSFVRPIIVIGGRGGRRR